MSWQKNKNKHKIQKSSLDRRAHIETIWIVYSQVASVTSSQL